MHTVYLWGFSVFIHRMEPIKPTELEMEPQVWTLDRELKK